MDLQYVYIIYKQKAPPNPNEIDEAKNITYEHQNMHAHRSILWKARRK